MLDINRKGINLNDDFKIIGFKITMQKEQQESKIKQTEKEIEAVGKALYDKIVFWVKAHPVLTLLFSFSLSVASNLVSQWLWNFFR